LTGGPRKGVPQRTGLPVTAS